MNTSTFTRHLFAVFAGLTLLTTGIRADVVPFSESYSSESTTEGWTTSAEDRFTPVIMSENDDYFLSVEQSQRYNNGCVVTGTILNGKAIASDDFTLMFDMRLGNANNQSPVELEIRDAANEGVVFSLSSASISTTVNLATWLINDTEKWVLLPYSGASSDISQIKWYSYKICRWHGLTFLTITDRETGEAVFQQSAIIGSSATGGLGNIVFKTMRRNANFAIDNIVLRAMEDDDIPTVVPVSYTVRFQDENGTAIKNDTTIVSYVGATISPTNREKESIMFDGKKYLYKEGENTITLTDDASSNVITLVFRPAAVYSYTIYANYGSNRKEWKKGTGFEGDAVTYYYPEYMLDGTTLYRTATKSANPHFGGILTLDTDQKEANIYYANGVKEDVVFYKEAEAMEGFVSMNTNNADIRCSDGKGGIIDGEKPVVLTTLPAGSYLICGQTWGTPGYTATVTANGSTVFSNTSTGAIYCSIEPFYLSEETTLYISNTGIEETNTYYTEQTGYTIGLKMLDYIWIQRIEAEPQFVAQFNRADSTLTFKKGIADNSTYAWDASDTSSGIPRWYLRRNYVTKVKFDKSFAEARPKSCRLWFYYFTKLREVEGIENLNTSETTDMYGMFNCCYSLTSLDVSHFDTGNVTNMGGMFNQCYMLEAIDVSHFNTENVTNMYYMFRNCESLTSLDVSHFDTHNVTDMGWMFCGCYSLENLDVSHFNTENVTRMTSMFWWCRNLKAIDVSRFNTEKVCDTGWMFNGCMSLEKLDLSNFNTANDTLMTNMFYACATLKELDLRSFNTAKVKEMDWMFRDCWNLETITVGDSWTTAQVAAADSMFYDCESLVGGAGTRYDSTHINYTYARVDGGADTPGYFTAATSSAILTHKRETGRKGNIYSLAGQKLNRPQRGVVIEGGKKAIVK